MATDSAKLDVISLLAAKVETTTGTAISVSGTDATLIVMGLTMVPDQPNNERQAMAGKGSLASTPGAQSGKCNFRVEVTGSGTSGSYPAWATIFLPACDLTASGGTFAFTNDVTTLTLVQYIDGVKKTLSGAKGNVKWTIEAGKPAYADFEFTGKYSAEADAAILSPTFPIVLAPIVGGGACTIGAYTPRISKLEIDSGNNVVLREDVTDATGYHAAAIPNRKPTFTMDPELDTIANRDWYTKYTASTEEALSIVVGATAGNTITFSATKAQTAKSPDGSRNGIAIKQIRGQLNSITPYQVAFT